VYFTKLTTSKTKEGLVYVVHKHCKHHAAVCQKCVVFWGRFTHFSRGGSGYHFINLTWYLFCSVTSSHMIWKLVISSMVVTEIIYCWCLIRCDNQDDM